MKETQGLVIIIDALNLFTRHFISHPAVNSNGQHAGGVVGFLYAIISFAEMYSPDQVIVVWEGGGSSRRRAIYSDYKQRRKPEKLNRFYEDDIPNTVENRNSQISLIVEILKKLPVCQIYVEDCEADDVIGYISKYKFLNNRKMIVSSDRDFYQLLDKNTIIYSPTWKKLVTSIEVRDKFGISPDNFCLAKSICGDVSDNIKGVPGVGFKTVAKRFPEMKENNTVTIQDIIDASRERIKDGSKIKIYQRIVDSESLIRRNWKLIYLDTICLAASQIKKINDIIDTFEPVRNKIQVMRIFIREGIQTFNVDRMFLAYNRVGASFGKQ